MPSPDSSPLASPLSNLSLSRVTDLETVADQSSLSSQLSNLSLSRVADLEAVAGRSPPPGPSGDSPGNNPLRQQRADLLLVNGNSSSAPSSTYCINHVEVLVTSSHPVRCHSAQSFSRSSSSTLVEDDDSTHFHPLFAAMVGGDHAKIKRLVAQGIRTAPRRCLWLYQFCLEGLDKMDLHRGVTLDCGSTLQYELLRTPATEFSSSKVDTIKHLWQHGVYPYYQDVLGHTALHWLAYPITQKTPPGTSEWLYENIREAESVQLMSYLLCMTRQGYFGSEADDLINMVNYREDSAIALAMLYSHEAAVHVLLAAGASPKLKPALAPLARRYGF